jgi:Fur family ferric uptake transcriptional regulator
MNRALFENLFAAKGIKMTEQRWVILSAVGQSRDHPDAETVGQRAKELDPEVGIATVYRTLTLFADLEIIQQHDFGDGRARYEIQTDHHHHLIDVDTGKVAEFQNADLERIMHQVAEDLGFELTAHRLELFGRKKK